jgi:hypothetical protein
MAGDLKNPEGHDLIDENYRHVATPRQVIHAGRSDLDGDDRPGTKFTAAVKDFAADGGFDRLRDERTAKDKDEGGTRLPGYVAGKPIMSGERESDLDRNAD